MIGKRISLILLTSLLVSSVGLGGWSTPISGLAQGTRDAAGVAIYPEPQEDVADVNVFYEPLAPFGTWTSVPEYGRVWSPHGVSPGWRPYTTGRWVYTDYGWTWVSDQEWGWAPFHYGRWASVASYGWVWIPGTVWGPAWVAWRHTPGWVGWAPLPPQVVFRPGIEFSAANMDVHIAPSWFSFVEERRILAPHVTTYIAPPARNASLIRMTQNVTNYTVIQNRVVNRSIPVERIERVIARPVPRMRIVETQAPGAMHRAKVREREREVVLFRPGAPAIAAPTGARVQTPQHTPPTQSAPGTTFPQQPQDAHRQQREQQRQDQVRQQQLQQQREQQQPQQQLQQRQDPARQQQLQHQRDQQLQQRQDPVRQQQLQQRQDPVRQQQLQQQQRNHQPPVPQGVPPQASQQQRAAPPQDPAEGKEHRKKQQQPPQGQQPSQQ